MDDLLGKNNQKARLEKEIENFKLEYGITNLKKLDEHLIEVILGLQREFYKIKIEKLEKEYEEIKRNLKVHKFEELQKEHQSISEKIFKNKLYRQYYRKSNAIIVGDEKQLPQIVDKTIKEKLSNIEVDICHDYFENSILSAILRTYGENIPHDFKRTL